jgi:hypothetical protein
MKIGVDRITGLFNASLRRWTSEQVRASLLLLTPEERERTTAVWLFENSMTYLPLEIFTILPNLEILSIHCNRIRELPNEMTRLSKLDSLVLTGTPIVQVPASYERLTNLAVLALDGTRLPPSLRQVSNLGDKKKTQKLLKRAVEHNRLLYGPVRNAIVVLLGLRQCRDVGVFRGIDKNVILLIAKSIWAQKKTWVRRFY